MTDRRKLLEILARIGNTFASKESSPKLRTELARAVSHSRSAVGVYLGTKMLFLLLGLAIGVGLYLFFPDMGLTYGVMVVTLVGAMLFFVPNLYVVWCRKRRSDEVRRSLPDAVDLLEICVSAGMGLDTTWNAVAEEFRSVSPTLADEMALTNLEMHLGADRGTALRHMAERTGTPELSSLVAVLVQTERFGTSISDTLRIFATNMRQLRRERAEEAAEKMSVKMLLPLVLLIFPVIMLVAVGPAALTLIDFFGGG
jgi:tight adherence protein C